MENFTAPPAVTYATKISHRKYWRRLSSIEYRKIWLLETHDRGAVSVNCFYLRIYSVPWCSVSIYHVRTITVAGLWSRAQWFVARERFADVTSFILIMLYRFSRLEKFGARNCVKIYDKYLCCSACDFS